MGLLLTRFSERALAFDVRNYGARGDGTSDDTAAIQAAIDAAAAGSGGAVTLAPGTYLVTSDITIPAGTITLEGASADASVLAVPGAAGFTSGVLVVTGMEPGPQIQDLGIRFAQPDSASLASLIPYPPAIMTHGCPRTKIARVKIERAWTAVDLRAGPGGNGGGTFVDLLEASFFGTGVVIDGAQDTVRLSRCQLWPFGLSANQQAAFADPAVIGIACGRCDDLNVTDALLICGTGMHLFRGASGPTFGSGADIAFDGHFGLLMEAGQLSLSGGYFSTLPGHWAIRLNGGELRLSNVYLGGGDPTIPLVRVASSPSAGPTLTIAGCQFNTDVADQTSLLLDSSAGGAISASVSGCTFRRAAGSYRAATIRLAGGGVAAAITGNTAQAPEGTGDAGTFVEIDDDTAALVVGNVLQGWTISVPDDATLPVIAENIP